MMPTEVPVPTRWSEEEKVMLVGTSLEVRFMADRYPGSSFPFLTYSPVCCFCKDCIAHPRI